MVKVKMYADLMGNHKNIGIKSLMGNNVKKNMKTMEECREELKVGLGKLGWTQQQLDTLWDIMIDFANYSFNRSHAVAYSILAWQMAKLKVYHPVEFMTALLNSKIGKKEEVSYYLNDCKNLGIEILPPDINKSDGKFTIENGGIRFGLLAISGVGEPTVKTIKDAINLYEEPFDNFEDFYVFTKSMSEEEKLDGLAIDSYINLVKSGAFGSKKDDIFEWLAEYTYTPLKWKPRKSSPSRKDLEKFNIEVSKDEFKDKEHITTLFNGAKYIQHEEKDEKRKQKHLDEFFRKYTGDSKHYEFQAMAYYLTESPFEEYSNYIKDFDKYDNDTDKILVVGTILNKEVKKSRGGQYAKLTLLTHHGVIQGKAYSNIYGENKDHFDKGNIIVALCKKARNEFIISKLKTFDEWKKIINKKKNLKEKKEKLKQKHNL
jgi:DNA polymerase III subunit alpha